ncbi:MAG: CPBP family glutamic-type intramembrane protease [Anaerolineae bacterium]|jgi:membrane protease YdiL (CAAX protease family)|nr:CPBP family glutamic-type intramembrane protease [Anaerolineae bacterium]
MTASVSVSAKPRSLLVFFALAFGISWIAWIPTTLASHGLVSFQTNPTFSDLLGAFGPFFAALITTAIYEGRAGFSLLFKRLLTWRVGIQWYVFVLLWSPMLSLAKTGIAVALGNAVPNFSQPPFVALYPLPPELANTVPFIAFLPFVFLQQMLIGSSMGEEPGWRGYALPRMQAQQGSFRASLLLGLLWGVWHLPLWLTKGHPVQGSSLGWTVLGLIATTVLFTWVTNHTKGSLLLALLLHSSIAVTGLFLASAHAQPWIEVALSWGMVALVMAGLEPKQINGGNRK